RDISRTRVLGNVQRQQCPTELIRTLEPVASDLSPALCRSRLKSSSGTSGATFIAGIDRSPSNYPLAPARIPSPSHIESRSYRVTATEYRSDRASSARP